MPSAPRVVALVGPYLSGKTTLLEALLFASGTTSRRGSVRDGNSVGDHAAEARARSDVDRDQRRQRDFSRRSVDDPRLPRLGRAALRGAAGDAGRRYRRRRLRARGRARRDGQRAAALSRRGTTSRTCCSSTSSTRRARGCATCWRHCNRSPSGRWCCARCRCAAARARSPAMSIWSASAPTATGRARPPT